MWLIDTDTMKFHWVNDPRQRPYAILSHVWDRSGEETFQDIQNIHADTEAHSMYTRPSPSDEPAPVPLEANTLVWGDKRFSEKLRNFCAFARANGYDHVWADMCCIDKTSSAELSEAINSMYEWYSRADVCYVFLHDVDDSEDPRAPNSAFRRSEWFTRGWTLQELIAPVEVVFLSRNWRMLGMRCTLASVIEEVTGIDHDVLLHVRPLDTVSVARRMSWASERKTTRTEDEAYSLMGIFGIFMPTIYGEGRHAFIRLQEEILKRIPDQSLFAWGSFIDTTNTSMDASYTLDFPVTSHLLAQSPADFASSAFVTPVGMADLAERIGLPAAGRRPSTLECTLTSHGVRVSVPILPLDKFTGLARRIPEHPLRHPDQAALAILACQDRHGSLIALLLKHVDHGSSQYVAGSIQFHRQNMEYQRVRGCVLRKGAPTTFSHESIAVADVYIVHSMNSIPPPRRSYLYTSPCAIIIPPWTLSHLEEAGFSSSLQEGESINLRFAPKEPRSVTLTVTGALEIITVHIAQCPLHSHWYPPLHVSAVSYSPSSPNSDTASTVQPESTTSTIAREHYTVEHCTVEHCTVEHCTVEHVHDWPGYEKTFPRAKDGPLVLRLTKWFLGTLLPEEGSEDQIYALETELVGPLGEAPPAQRGLSDYGGGQASDETSL